MLTLHHLEYSQSFRILWLLEELGVEYSLVKYERDKKTHSAPAEYKALSPLGTAPVIIDGDLTLAESNAIVDYILDQYPDNTLRPAAGTSHRNRYLFWFHAAQGSMMPIVLMDALFQIIKQRVPSLVRFFLGPILDKATASFVKPRMNALLQQAERDLEDAPWFGGDELTAADIALCYPMESAARRGYISTAYPNCKAWLQRVHAHPSFAAARKKDGRDSMVLPI